ncbi:apolipoprotein C-II isoform X1 [Hippopotamus amphibius kiboko]|uniref:apolipoprotein C-II isoform X1 n=1 Tax=Hippopotamus amphibius kiboko TaxID=575201 RepID=UPI002597AC3A|nr:apolipoprotein C-II isoform X1 [Hippopotamus amphibius kiboko]
MSQPSLPPTPPPALSGSVGQDFGLGIEAKSCGGVDLKRYKAFLCLFGAGEDSSPESGLLTPWARDTSWLCFSSSWCWHSVQESLLGYWDTAKAAAQSLYEKTYLPVVDEKIRDMYSKSTAAVTTYAGIFTDQVLSLLKGED